MRKIVTYKCDHCGYEYETEEEAIVCEQNHILKLSVIDSIYYSMNDIPDGYPEKVVLSGEDGEQVVYKRDR